MKILLKSVTIISPGSSYHNKSSDILIENGKISKIGTSVKENADEVIKGKDLYVSLGWLDMGAHIGDPGLEHKEDFASASKAASFGGFTSVAIYPNTVPVIQSKEAVQYVKNSSKLYLTDYLPIGAATLKNEGLELTEMHDLHVAGAVAFSDGKRPIWHTGVFLKALQYVQAFNGVVIDQCKDIYLNEGGLMHEGKNSTILGLKGMPALGEEVALEKAVNILRYSGGKLHVADISTKGAVEIIKMAKKEGLGITCGIAAHQIAFDDEVLFDFDTNYKVKPPFRSKKDIKAIVNGLVDGTIDVVTSSHDAHEADAKNLEFDYADFGILGLQTTYCVLNSKQNKLGQEGIVEKLALNPRKVLGLPISQVEEGMDANLTLFDAEEEWVFTKEDILSKSKNTPFIDCQFRGKVKAIFNKGMHQIYA